MSFFFDVYGPFDVDRIDGVVTGSQKGFWKQVRDWDADLVTAHGCYMFCLSHGRSIMPWYVGKAEGKEGFGQEVFAKHKLEVFNECLDYKRGKPKMFLFPMMTADGGEASRFSRDKTNGKRVIPWLEKTLMGMALQRNPDLWNIRDTTLPRSVTVRGLIGEAQKGRPYTEVSEARRALFG